MRLKSIKLAGFKSFVEPTRISLLADMTAVVGPNGCGKSNVIDAVRWVLGESSARHLRGENMTDVIFNGSSNRPPHSRASVELIFDNPHNRVPGEFGRFTEIAVRREVYRDGNNLYFINGQKCRRKDVTDLFLGTGLGPRSYAIIEQGTVSRLVESRPADLKLFLEEAAGVSRYKERRRETEQRIRHTRDNLERLGDIRGELGERLEHLKAQAETAERYRLLKGRSRAARSELIGSELWGIENRLAEIKGGLAEQELALAALDARRTQDEAQTLTLATARQERQAEQADRQQQIFLGGQAIARLEQQTLHRAEQDKEWQRRRAALAERMQRLTAQLSGEEARLAQLQTGCESAELAHEEAQARQEEAQLRQQAGLERLERVRSQREQWQRRLGELQGEQTRLRTEVNHREELLARIRLTRLKLEDERGEPLQPLALSPLPPLEEALAVAEAGRSSAAVRLAQCHGEQREAQARWQGAQGALREQQARLQTLEALLGEEPQGGLGAQLTLDEAWAKALDKVLGHWLGATTGEPDDEAVLGRFVGLADAPLAGTLAERVSGACLPSFLNAIRTAPDRASALALRPTLTQGESVITPLGEWFGRNWADLGESQRLGRLALQAEAERLAGEVALLDADVVRLAALHEQADAQARVAEAGHGSATTLVRAAEQALQQAREQWRLEEGRQSERGERHQRIADELTRLDEELCAEQARQEAACEALCLAEERLEEWLAQGLAQEEALPGAQREQQGLDESLELARQARERAHADLLRLQQEQLSCRHLCELHRTELVRVQGEHAQLALPESGEAVDLAPLLETQRRLEAEQLATHQTLAHLESELSALDKRRQEDHKALIGLQEKLAQLRLERERLLTRRQALHEQFEELGVRFADLDQAALLQADRGKLRQEIQTLEEQVTALGAINLAALEEYEEARTRAEYMENQCQDLEQALETLELAIKRIDRETQIRFRDTFDKVNEDLKSLFPKVFGGGSAWLELTSDDLLEAGVTIMARPPGKKNATIALLSGGEKALTALALVFAIFRLNPAPFCMLDEVDAPLDEVNVGRFCSLVKEMSSTVQFVYISHNKVSMEMAEQLVGVTMQEPGVSRIVSVDIGEAVALAEQN
ncbi:AAA family ATPase [Aeromonas diversa]|uniref:AAA family ATPase n=1 Tax=Aeromonas diversa TaxID=502790 RepID=UPI0039A3404E